MDVIDDALGTFFEFVKDVGQGLIDAFRLMFGEEVTRKFSLVDIDAPYRTEISPGVDLAGEFTFGARLVVGIQINPSKLAARAGFEADYSCLAKVEISYEVKVDLLSKEINLWEGKEQSKEFKVGPVPVWVHWYVWKF